MVDLVSVYNAKRLQDILRTCHRSDIPEPEQIFFLSDGSTHICKSKHLDDAFNKIREWFYVEE